VTDGQTDGIVVANTALALHSQCSSTVNLLQYCPKVQVTA